VVEHLFSKCEALSSTPSTTGKNKKKTKEIKHHFPVTRKGETEKTDLFPFEGREEGERESCTY
jgi:hypothetical protein